MLNLAICDNEPAIIEELEEYLDKISDISFDYEVFFSAEELYSYKKKQELDFDVYILDIEMGEMSGLELAKNIVALGLAEKCEVQLSYAIGIANPVSVNVNTFGTGKKDDELLAEFIYNNFDLTPSGIIDIFKLRRPIYEKVASYGHFGRTELNLPWEQLDTKKFLGILEV